MFFAGGGFGGNCGAGIGMRAADRGWAWCWRRRRVGSEIGAEVGARPKAAIVFVGGGFVRNRGAGIGMGSGRIRDGLPWCWRRRRVGSGVGAEVGARPMFFAGVAGYGWQLRRRNRDAGSGLGMCWLGAPAWCWRRRRVGSGKWGRCGGGGARPKAAIVFADGSSGGNCGAGIGC